MVQRNSIKKKSRLTKKRIVALGAIAFFVLFPMATLMLLLEAGGIQVVFPILVFLPVSAMLLLTFAGVGAIGVWAFFSRDLKRVLPLCLALVLPAFVAAIFMVVFPHTLVGMVLTHLLFLPISAVLLSLFVGLGAIIVWAPLRRDLGRVLKLVKFTFGAIVLSSFLWLPLCGLSNLSPILTFLIAALVVAYLYWPGKKRGLFLGVLGPVLALELAVLLTINLIIF